MRSSAVTASGISKCSAWIGTEPCVASILFITGTDTGAGKTLVTASFLYWMRKQGMDVLAMKPFCSGSREDVRLLQAIQPGELSDPEANPFFFRKPLAPLVAARQKGKVVRSREVLDRIHKIAARCEILLVEGAGGLLSPLGEKLTAAELIRDLKAHVCVVAANKLGTINHTLLTARTLASFARKSVSVILTQTARNTDRSAASNRSLIAELLSPIPVWSLPYLGAEASSLRAIERNFRRTRHVWAALARSLHK